MNPLDDAVLPLIQPRPVDENLDRQDDACNTIRVQAREAGSRLPRAHIGLAVRALKAQPVHVSSRRLLHADHTARAAAHPVE